jgi:hypothetical protein
MLLGLEAKLLYGHHAGCTLAACRQSQAFSLRGFCLGTLPRAAAEYGLALG